MPSHLEPILSQLSPINFILCFLHNSLKKSISGTLPNTGDTNIALVLEVIFSSILVTSKFKVSYSISTNTGVRLFCTITEIVVGNPTGETIISSPSTQPKYFLRAAIKTFIEGKWVVAGENVHKFERRFGKLFGAKYVQMVNSGSSANLVLMTALKKYFGWVDGDEIIVSPVGFPTTISVIVQNNLTPVFVDIEYDTLNFDVTKIEEKITSRTKAIFVSPVLGNVPDMDFLSELCKKHNIKLIGDSCDSIGSKWDGKHLSEYYEAWTSSFYPAHHISTGEGGAVCTNIAPLKKIIY